MAASAAKTLNQIGNQVGNEQEYEFEDPASMWMELVEACRLEPTKRRAAVERVLIEARNSHWTPELWAEELALCAGDPDVDWGTDYPPQELGDTPEYLEQEGKDQEHDGVPVDMGD